MGSSKSITITTHLSTRWLPMQKSFLTFPLKPGLLLSSLSYPSTLWSIRMLSMTKKSHWKAISNIKSHWKAISNTFFSISALVSLSCLLCLRFLLLKQTLGKHPHKSQTPLNLQHKNTCHTDEHIHQMCPNSLRLPWLCH